MCWLQLIMPPHFAYINQVHCDRKYSSKIGHPVPLPIRIREPANNFANPFIACAVNLSRRPYGHAQLLPLHGEQRSVGRGLRKINAHAQHELLINKLHRKILHCFLRVRIPVWFCKVNLTTL